MKLIKINEAQSRRLFERTNEQIAQYIKSQKQQ